MNEKALRVLEFNKIKDKLSSYAVSPMGKELAQKLEPMHYLEDIRSAQEETTAAASMILRKGNLPLGGLTEVRPQLKRVSMGGVLNCKELITIGNFLYVCTKVKSYGKKEKVIPSRTGPRAMAPSPRLATTMPFLRLTFL